MKRELRDSAKPAGFVFVEDGKHIRNDGVELRPAEENPWYVLATVCGEHSGSTDNATLAENRRIWNGWMLQKHLEHRNATSAKRLKSENPEVEELGPDDHKRIQEAFRERLDGCHSIPSEASHVDFSRTFLSDDKVLYLDGFLFFGKATFDRSVFHGPLVLSRAKISGKLDFSNVHLREPAHLHHVEIADVDFDYTRFESHALFSSAKFGASGYATSSFKNAQFLDVSEFDHTMFGNVAKFNSCFFDHGVSFQHSHFKRGADFRRANLVGEVDFRATFFKERVPRFEASHLSQDTKFFTEKDYWPDPSPQEYSNDPDAYSRLRRFMSEQQKPDEEHFFFRQEMRCKVASSKQFDWFWLRSFEYLSDFGYSVSRPATVLCLSWLAPALIYGWYFGPGCFEGYAVSPSGCRTETIWSLVRGFGFSFANLFAFLGLNRIHFGDVWNVLPRELSFLAGAQTVLGFVFLFFLGLGLRNRFRLK